MPIVIENSVEMWKQNYSETLNENIHNQANDLEGITINFNKINYVTYKFSFYFALLDYVDNVKGRTEPKFG